MPRGRVSQDWTGQIFNNCKIIEPVNENEKAGYKPWKVLCHCGKIFNAPPSSVKQGMYQSCGCYRKKASQERMQQQQPWKYQIKEYIGNEYNGCKILEPVDQNLVRSHSYYKIQCSCGNIFEARFSNIQSGVIRSCGCAKLGTKEWHKNRRIKNGFDPNISMMKVDEYFRRTFFTPEIKKIIYERDKNQCQLCKIEDPGYMKVHHIVPIKEFMHSVDMIELSQTYNYKNLVLLCEPCHIYSAHSKNTAKNINKKIQLELIEIIKNKNLTSDLLKRYSIEVEKINKLFENYLSAKINS